MGTSISDFCTVIVSNDDGFSLGMSTPQAFIIAIARIVHIYVQILLLFIILFFYYYEVFLNV